MSKLTENLIKYLGDLEALQVVESLLVDLELAPGDVELGISGALWSCMDIHPHNTVLLISLRLLRNYTGLTVEYGFQGNYGHGSWRVYKGSRSAGNYLLYQELPGQEAIGCYDKLLECIREYGEIGHE